MMDWREKQECLLCSRGGKLLVCNGDGCPISVHKDCMGCEAYLDDDGNFHCPYCVYRQVTAETCQLREKAMLAKKALSTFLEEQMIDGNHQQPIVGLANKDKQILSEDKICSLDGNKLVPNEVQYQRIHLEKDPNSKTRLPCEETHETFVSDRPGEEVLEIQNVNSCRAMVVYKPKSNLVETRGLDCDLPKQDRMKTDQLKLDVTKRIKADNRTRNAKRKFNEIVDNQPRTTTSLEEAAQSKNAGVSYSAKKESIGQKENPFAAFNKNGDGTLEECMREHAAKRFAYNSKINNDKTFLKDRRHTRHEPAHLLNHPNGNAKGSLEAKNGAESINVGNRGVLKDPSKQMLVMDRSIKPRVLWSEEEEDMLKEGVQRFSLLTRKNLPWKKILEFGHHVFDPSRNPSDLKDKWRNMAK